MRKREFHVGQRVRITERWHAGVVGTIESITPDGRALVSHESPFLRGEGPEGTVLLPYYSEEMERVLRAVQSN